MNYLLALLSTASMLILSQTASGQEKQAEKSEATFKLAYINEVIEQALIASVGPLDPNKLYGQWKQVLYGPSRSYNLGVYDSRGIKYRGQELILTISAMETSWLPQSVNRQFIMIPSLSFNQFTAHVPAAGAIVGDHLVIGVGFHCGLTHNNSDHMICHEKFGSNLIGLQRIISEK